jgi:phosphatidylethanolamine-binding protein (PEBP) family uncharacterized protein
MNRWAVLLTTSVALFGCSKSMHDTPSAAPGTTPQTLTVTSATFSEGGQIPSDETCDGTNAPPPLKWSEPPAGTQSFAVIVDDPDASQGRPFVHWLVYNIPSTSRNMPVTGLDSRFMHSMRSFRT